jgi:hypothetical protein
MAEKKNTSGSSHKPSNIKVAVRIRPIINEDILKGVSPAQEKLWCDSTFVK